MTRHVVRAEEIDWERAPRGRHPFNPASEMRMVRLGDMSGLKRIGANLVRIPPGKESFIPHAHLVEEEMAFVIEGAGEVVLDGVRHPIGPGDYVGFPTDGVVHSLVNTGAVDLVYLTVGERARVEVATMPTIGKTIVFHDNRMTRLDHAGLDELTAEEWVAKMQLPPEG